MKLKFSRQIFEESSNIKFNQNPSSSSRVVSRGRTDMTKIIFAFRNFANVPKDHFYNIFPLMKINLPSKCCSNTRKFRVIKLRYFVDFNYQSLNPDYEYSNIKAFGRLYFISSFICLYRLLTYQYRWAHKSVAQDLTPSRCTEPVRIQGHFLDVSAKQIAKTNQRRHARPSVCLSSRNKATPCGLIL
jgi:hypothetical protein